MKLTTATKLVFLCCLVGVSLLFMGCPPDDCYDQELDDHKTDCGQFVSLELLPNALDSINGGVYDTAYALNGLSQIINKTKEWYNLCERPYDHPVYFIYLEHEVDSVQFVFTNAHRSDTLLMVYDLELKYSSGCSYYTEFNTFSFANETFSSIGDVVSIKDAYTLIVTR